MTTLSHFFPFFLMALLLFLEIRFQHFYLSYNFFILIVCCMCRLSCEMCFVLQTDVRFSFRVFNIFQNQIAFHSKGMGKRIKQGDTKSFFETKKSRTYVTFLFYFYNNASVKVFRCIKVFLTFFSLLLFGSVFGYKKFFEHFSFKGCSVSRER